MVALYIQTMILAQVFRICCEVALGDGKTSSLNMASRRWLVHFVVSCHGLQKDPRHHVGYGITGEDLLCQQACDMSLDKHVWKQHSSVGSWFICTCLSSVSSRSAYVSIIVLRRL